MHTLLRDVHYAWRAQRKSPGFFAVAVLTIALGIGATTSIFGVLYSVLLKPLPYPEPERMVRAFEVSQTGTRMRLSRLDFEDWQRQSTSFTHLAAYWTGLQPLVGAGEPFMVSVAPVTPEFFPVLGVQPLMGRWPGSAQSGEAAISERVWKTTFGADPKILGRALRIGDDAYTVVAVMPAALDFPTGSRVWVPLDMTGDNSTRSAHNYHVIGRLTPGVAHATAEAEVQAIAARLAAEYPDTNKNVGAALVPLQETMTASLRPTLLLLLGMVGLVLVIGSTNVGTLMLVRTASRSREIALRAALGASTGQIARQLLTETVLLFLIGGALGALLAVWIGALVPVVVPGLAGVAAGEVDGIKVGFAIAISLFAGLGVGLFPALSSRRGDLVANLRSSSVSGGGGERMRAAFIVAEVALCVVLLAGAALTARTLLALHAQSLGMEPSGVLAVQAPLHFSQTDAPRAYSELIERLRHLPGVESVGATSALPMSGGGSNGNFQIEGRQVLSDSDQTWAAWRVVDEAYFPTLHIPISAGRSFTTSDRGGESVVVINQAMARAYWPGEDPLGKRIAIPGFDQQTFARYRAGSNEWFTIIGIVGDVRDESVSAPPVPQLYVPYFQRRDADLDIVLRTGLPLASIEKSVKQVIHDFDPQVPVRVLQLEEFLSTSIATPRLRSLLIGAFASIAWILAAVGLYGVMAFSVERRTAEMGVRSVFGATRFNLLSMVIKRGLSLVGIGLAAGIVVVLALRGAIAKFLYGVSASDPIALIAVCLLLLVMGVLASIVPARRATQVDPLVALRYE